VAVLAAGLCLLGVPWVQLCLVVLLRESMWLCRQLRVCHERAVEACPVRLAGTGLPDCVCVRAVYHVLCVQCCVCAVCSVLCSVRQVQCASVQLCAVACRIFLCSDCVFAVRFALCAVLSV